MLKHELVIGSLLLMCQNFDFNVAVLHHRGEYLGDFQFDGTSPVFQFVFLEEDNVGQFFQ